MTQRFRPDWYHLVAGALLVAGCAPRASTTSVIPRDRPWVQETFYFGRNIPGAGRPDSAVVSREQWDAFASATLAPALGGYTVVDAIGGFVDDRGRVVAESTKVVVWVHPDTAVSTVDQAVARYIQLFRQQSVGRVVAPVLRASF